MLKLNSFLVPVTADRVVFTGPAKVAMSSLQHFYGRGTWEGCFAGRGFRKLPLSDVRFFCGFEGEISEISGHRLEGASGVLQEGGYLDRVIATPWHPLCTHRDEAALVASRFGTAAFATLSMNVLASAGLEELPSLRIDAYIAIAATSVSISFVSYVLVLINILYSLALHMGLARCAL